MDGGLNGGSRTVGDGYNENHTITARAFDTENQVSSESTSQASSGPPPAPTSWVINVPYDSCAEDSDSTGLHFNSTSKTCSSYWVKGDVTVYCYSDWRNKQVEGNYRWYRMGDGWYVSSASTDTVINGMGPC
ncbi:hypothetical protein Q0F99_14030 [Rathayibacter oskolensis]|uniref:hypothetical protein n=1 Tax=Rathayibacter oskolensis TaxID=1891671 RepID=UPI00265FAE53|nr:hypothetical protein [Rathayibacter oskolensis]WKK70862.1 hypothetical protein Q0F99_14030 [Rathayibacter oskolensis]